MTIREVLRAILRGEVDAIDYDADYRRGLVEQERERERDTVTLRATHSETHPTLEAALERRRQT